MYFRRLLRGQEIVSADRWSFVSEGRRGLLWGQFTEKEEVSEMKKAILVLLAVLFVVGVAGAVLAEEVDLLFCPPSCDPLPI